LIKLKRVYEEAENSDGMRILVERLWPRGFTKERAAFDLWRKEVAPSTELRKWFGHDPAKWPEFRRRYLEELAQEPARTAAATIRRKAEAGNVTLVYSAHDVEHNAAVVLQEYLTGPN
jgi:uncharacterized protein YeaO (DUF488 family)